MQLALETAQQRLEAARARLRAATIQLEYTEIPSPIDGVITERLVEVGDRVNGNEEVFSVEEFPPLWARIFVPERDLPQLKVAQKAQVRVDTFPDQEFEAAIKMINPTIDATSGTVKVTLEMQRTDRLRPGMFGTVYIATETRPEAIVIPKKAVLRERDENRIFVITAEDLVEKREVVLGFSEEDRVEVLEGIQEGKTSLRWAMRAWPMATLLILSPGREHLLQKYPRFLLPRSQPLLRKEGVAMMR